MDRGARADRRAHFRPARRCRQPDHRRPDRRDAAERHRVASIRSISCSTAARRISCTTCGSPRPASRPSSRDAQNPVAVRLADETDYKHNGRMDFVDNAVNPKTGTIRGRAIFDNKDGLLTPGFFGRLRLFGGDARRAADSRQRDRIRSGEQDRVHGRRRRHGRHQDGRARPDRRRPARRSVGLAPTDRIVIDGLPRARPGQKVKAEDGKIEAAAK